MPGPAQSAAVIFGVGALEGIGAAVALRAAAGGMPVYISGRHEDKLNAVAEAIRSQGGKAHPITADISRSAEVARVFEQLEHDGLSASLVVHNVGSNVMSPFLDLTPELMETSWRTNCLSGFIVSQQAIRHMLPRGTGTLLFTGATASVRGGANFAAFAAGKSGLRIYAQAMAREFGPKGIHVAHVIVDGVVNGDRMQRFMPSMIEERGENGTLTPASIAETYWQLHQQPHTTWTHELDLRPFSERW